MHRIIEGKYFIKKCAIEIIDENMITLTGGKKVSLRHFHSCQRILIGSTVKKKWNRVKNKVSNSTHTV